MEDKCMAKCKAQVGIQPHLWLRKDIFYCRIELSKVGGKRRYFCYSLHTSNYYEALGKMDEIKDFNAKFDKLCQLYAEIKTVKKSRYNLPPDCYGLCLNIPDELFLSGNNEPQTIIDFTKLFMEVNQNIEKYNVQKEMLDKLNAMEDKLKLIEKTVGADLFKKIAGASLLSKPEYTLQYMLDSMLMKANNGGAETTRKRHFFEGIFKDLNLSLNDDYSKFHTVENIQKLSESIVNQQDIKNDNKRQKLRYIKEFVEFACKLEPDFYKKISLYQCRKLRKLKRVRGILI